MSKYWIYTAFERLPACNLINDLINRIYFIIYVKSGDNSIFTSRMLTNNNSAKLYYSYITAA